MADREGTPPPYTITPSILNLVEQIGEVIGGVNEPAIRSDLRLRRANRIRTTQGSLAIEGNTLSEEQISTILDGKHVIAPLREVQEVRNAIKVYEKYPDWNPASETDLFEAQALLMLGLLDAPGRYRRDDIAVAGRGEVHHIGPSPNRVPPLMSNLLSWLDGAAEHPLIASLVFHYEFEFIHPFEDGNGRMGRLWQSLILTCWKPLFAQVPVESLIYARQSEYFEAIRDSSAQGASTPFIIFMLETILEAVISTPQETSQVEHLLAVLEGEMSLRQVMDALALSDRKSFRQRYLLPALELGFVEMTLPESPTARNQKYRLTANGRRFARRS